MRANRNTLAAAVIAALVAVPAAGCSSSSHGNASASARAAASSLTANPVYQQDKARLEALLLVNFKKDFNPAHPVASVKTAVQDTFPGGSSNKIVDYAVKTFTLAAAKPGAKRRAWIQDVVTFALNQGAQGVGTGTPSIPGVTAPATVTSS